MTALAVVFGAVVYLLFVVAPAVLLCKGITLADKQEQPAEILAPADVDRRFERFEEWA